MQAKTELFGFKIPRIKDFKNNVEITYKRIWTKTTLLEIVVQELSRFLASNVDTIVCEIGTLECRYLLPSKFFIRECMFEGVCWHDG